MLTKLQGLPPLSNGGTAGVLCFLGLHPMLLSQGPSLSVSAPGFGVGSFCKLTGTSSAAPQWASSGAGVVTALLPLEHQAFVPKHSDSGQFVSLWHTDLG